MQFFFFRSGNQGEDGNRKVDAGEITVWFICFSFRLGTR